jgi:protein-S-isoprenylcysteine O-methyltransferase Ste14
MSGPELLTVFAVVFGALFGFVYLIDRRSKSQQRTGKPSRLIRVSAIVVGLIGIAFGFWVGWPLSLAWWLIPAIIILLGYGFFGLFRKDKPVQPMRQ